MPGLGESAGDWACEHWLSLTEDLSVLLVGGIGVVGIPSILYMRGVVLSLRHDDLVSSRLAG
jgi:hypothetical protein